MFETNLAFYLRKWVKMTEISHCIFKQYFNNVYYVVKHSKNNYVFRQNKILCVVALQVFYIIIKLKQKKTAHTLE